ncbi:MAG: hypothetical protein RQ723_09925 [Desulfuromonadales bacterium]|nr:hypothetical protein [Desulfuromonadales bacterium]
MSKTESPSREPFVFWQPDQPRLLRVGPEQRAVELPVLPLPLNRADLQEGEPTDTAIGQGLYDYLRRHPDCLHNREYAGLLRDAFPHLLSDLAAQAVMLDAKEVDPAYVLRKLTALKILRLLEPDNKGLLHQLSRGFFDLAMTLSELPNCRRYLLEAMRAAHRLHQLDPDDLANLDLLAEIDMLFCDYPSAAVRWQRLLDAVDDPATVQKATRQLAVCQSRAMPERTRVDDLEDFGAAMNLYGSRQYALALAILERLEESAEFVEEFAGADFFYLLGVCRREQGDQGGAVAALQQALGLAADYQPARDALEQITL